MRRSARTLAVVEAVVQKFDEQPGARTRDMTSQFIIVQGTAWHILDDDELNDGAPAHFANAVCA